MSLYEQFRSKDKNPVMLFDVQEQRVYSYPYDGFKKTLGEKSKNSLKLQYEDAVANEGIVIFVRDSEKRVLRSYTLNKNLIKK